MKMSVHRIRNSVIFAIWLLLNLILILNIGEVQAIELFNLFFFNAMFFYLLNKSFLLFKSKKMIIHIKNPVFYTNIIYLIVLFVVTLFFPLMITNETSTTEIILTVVLFQGIPLVIYLIVAGILSVDNIKATRNLQETGQHINYIETVANSLQELFEDFEGDQTIKQKLFDLYEKVKYSQITTNIEAEKIEKQLVMAVDLLLESIEQGDEDNRDILIDEINKLIKRRERTLKGM